VSLVKGDVKIRKSTPAQAQGIKKLSPNPELKFSFKLFNNDDEQLCPSIFRDGYTQTLMERLRDLSSWTVRRFTENQDKSVRNHAHDWDRTSRPNGFTHLNESFREYAGWQFCLSANERGRVHGIIIDDTFYVIWLDQDHALYPGK
jgi:hypothetical protein